MSNETVLRFDRPLRDVRKQPDRTAQAEQRRVGTVEELQLADREQQLVERGSELDRRESALTQREAELAEREKGLDRELEQVARLISSLHEEKLEMLESNEEEIVSFSLSIAEKLLQHQIEHGRYKIGEVVRSALRAVRDRGPVVVRVNPRDHELTKRAVEKLGQTYGRTRITTVPDDSIPLASCCIETESGKIFSEIPGRLKKLEKTLLKENGEPNGL